MKKDLLPISFLLLPLINLGQTVQPIERIVVTKLDSTTKEGIKITPSNPKYVSPIHTEKSIETISIKKELKEDIKANGIGLSENYFKNRIIKSESDSLKFKGKTSPEFKIGLSEFKPATMSIRKKNNIGISLSENYLKNEITKSESDSLKSPTKSVRKHGFGLGTGILFDFLDEKGGFPLSMHYKYVINLNKQANFLFIQAGYSWLRRDDDNIKSHSIISLELGSQKRYKYLFDWTSLYASVGIATFLTKGYGPLYVKENNKLIKKEGEQKQYLTIKLGWGGDNLIGDNLSMNVDFTYFHNFKSAWHEKYWGSLNFQLMYYINKNK